MVCLAAIAGAKTVFPPKSPAPVAASSESCLQRASDTTGGLWLSISNRMTLGRAYDDLAITLAPETETIENLPFEFGAAFPSGVSKSNYLYGAGLWVGGIKNGDTLVSQAFDDLYFIPEFVPGPCPDGEIIADPGFADMAYTSSATDTSRLIDTLTRCLMDGCEFWRPLGLEVSSTSHIWQSSPYSKAVIVEYSITNISTDIIEDTWLGILADCDIGYGDTAYSDDLSGFLRGGFDMSGRWRNLNIAYSVDLNGDPGVISFDSTSANGVFGVQLLGLQHNSIPRDVSSPNFNWWCIDDSLPAAWGPQRVVNPLGDLGYGAAPIGDPNKYRLMSQPEIDYNQVEAAVTHYNWRSPPSGAKSIARGADTRFLLSVPSGTLMPGDSLALTIAIIFGEAYIENRFLSWWFDPEDQYSLSDYYEVINFDDLIASGMAAQDVYTNGWEFPPPGPPRNLTLTEYTETTVDITWLPGLAQDIAGYSFLLRKDNDAWNEYRRLTADQFEIAVSNLEPFARYEFAVASIDAGNSVGKKSSPLSLIPASPHPPRDVIGNGRQGYPQLVWSPPDDVDVDFYRVYRSGIDDLDFLVLSETVDTSFRDTQTSLGKAYQYYITAVDFDNLESGTSDTISIIPMFRNRGIMVIDQNRAETIANPAFTSELFENLITHALDSAGIGYRYHNFYTDGPLDIAELQWHSLVIISGENLYGSLDPQLASVLEDYLRSGGKGIFIQRHGAVGIRPKNSRQIVRHESSSLFKSLLHIDSSYIGPFVQSFGPGGYQLDGDMIGADSQVDSLPDLVWDSTAVNQFGYAVPDGLPYCGFLWSQPPAQPIYRYVSAAPSGATDSQVCGIRYRGETYSFVYLNMPLSLMRQPEASLVLRRLVADLEEVSICGDITGDYNLNLGDLIEYYRYLFFDFDPVFLEEAGDIDCDGVYGMSDAVYLFNFLFKGGNSPDCCR